MAETKDVFEVLECAIEVEVKASELYSIFCKKFADNDMAKYLWNSFALEEESHANFLKSEMKMIKTAPVSFGSEATVDLSLFEDAVKVLDGFIGRATNEDITIKDALCMAFDVENMIVEKKYGEIVEILSPGLKKVFAEITEKSDHVDKLRSAATALGVECSEDN